MGNWHIHPHRAAESSARTGYDPFTGSQKLLLWAISKKLLICYWNSFLYIPNDSVCNIKRLECRLKGCALSLPLLPVFPRGKLDTVLPSRCLGTQAFGWPLGQVRCGFFWVSLRTQVPPLGAWSSFNHFGRNNKEDKKKKNQSCFFFFLHIINEKKNRP